MLSFDGIAFVFIFKSCICFVILSINGLTSRHNTSPLFSSRADPVTVFVLIWFAIYKETENGTNKQSGPKGYVNMRNVYLFYLQIVAVVVNNKQFIIFPHHFVCVLGETQWIILLSASSISCLAFLVFVSH